MENSSKNEDLINKLCFVKASNMPGYCLARVLAQYPHGWYLLSLEGTGASFTLPRKEIAHIIEEDLDLVPIRSIPEISEKFGGQGKQV